MKIVLYKQCIALDTHLHYIAAIEGNEDVFIRIRIPCQPMLMWSKIEEKTEGRIKEEVRIAFELDPDTPLETRYLGNYNNIIDEKGELPHPFKEEKIKLKNYEIYKRGARSAPKGRSS